MAYILLFGDSITWGACDEQNGGWAERLKLSGFEEDFTIYNCGISGDTTEELKERITNEFKAREKRHEGKVKVVIAIGINDSRYVDRENTPQTDEKEFKNNLLHIFNELDTLKHFNTAEDLAFIGLTKVDEELTLPWNIKELYWENDRIQSYNDIIKNLCTSKNIPFLDILDLLDKEDLCDGLHPNAKGHAKMAEKIKEFLKDNKFI